MINNKYIICIVLLISTVCLLILYNKFHNKQELTAYNLNDNCICANDSMIIIDYKGPKAQILWNDNTRSYYCEVREAFYEYTNKTRKKNIKAFFVQDFSYIEWGSYLDKWIPAEKAYYVIDSTMNGAMGLTYVPFSDIECAKNFFQRYQGKLLHFNDITLETLEKSNDILKDRLIT